MSRKATQLFIASRLHGVTDGSQLPGVSRKECQVCSFHESTICSFQVCPGRCRRCAASRCVQEEVDDVQLPGVSRKVSTMCSFQVCPGRSRRCATSRCVQEGGSTVRRFPVCPGRRGGVNSASRCVQEGWSTVNSVQVYLERGPDPEGDNNGRESDFICVARQLRSL